MTSITTNVSLWDATAWHTAYEWALKNFGQTFVARGSTWEFNNEQDAVIFALKWC